MGPQASRWRCSREQRGFDRPKQPRPASAWTAGGWCRAWASGPPCIAWPAGWASEEASTTVRRGCGSIWSAAGRTLSASSPRWAMPCRRQPGWSPSSRTGPPAKSRFSLRAAHQGRRPRVPLDSRSAPNPLARPCRSASAWWPAAWWPIGPPARPAAANSKIPAAAAAVTPSSPAAPAAPATRSPPPNPGAAPTPPWRPSCPARSAPWSSPIQPIDASTLKRSAARPAGPGSPW